MIKNIQSDKLKQLEDIMGSNGIKIAHIDNICNLKDMGDMGDGPGVRMQVTLIMPISISDVKEEA